MILGGGIRPKDFSLVKQGGYYHLFYIRNNTALPAEQTETDFGHSVSTDLYHWTQLPNALGVDLGEWDNAHLWAPSVFQHDGLWWMFYTGVSDWPGSSSGRSGWASRCPPTFRGGSITNRCSTLR